MQKKRTKKLIGGAKKKEKPKSNTSEEEPSDKDLDKFMEKEFSHMWFVVDQNVFTNIESAKSMATQHFKQKRNTKKGRKKVNKISSVSGIQKREKGKSLSNAIKTGLSKGRADAQKFKSRLSSMGSKGETFFTDLAKGKLAGVDIGSRIQGVKNYAKTQSKKTSSDTYRPSGTGRTTPSGSNSSSRQGNRGASNPQYNSVESQKTEKKEILNIYVNSDFLDPGQMDSVFDQQVDTDLFMTTVQDFVLNNPTSISPEPPTYKYTGQKCTQYFKFNSQLVDSNSQSFSQLFDSNSQSFGGGRFYRRSNKSERVIIFDDSESYGKQFGLDDAEEKTKKKNIKNFFKTYKDYKAKNTEEWLKNFVIYYQFINTYIELKYYPLFLLNDGKLRGELNKDIDFTEKKNNIENFINQNIDNFNINKTTLEKIFNFENEDEKTMFIAILLFYNEGTKLDIKEVRAHRRNKKNTERLQILIENIKYDGTNINKKLLTHILTFLVLTVGETDRELDFFSNKMVSLIEENIEKNINICATVFIENYRILQIKEFANIKILLFILIRLESLYKLYKSKTSDFKDFLIRISATLQIGKNYFKLNTIKTMEIKAGNIEVLPDVKLPDGKVAIENPTYEEWIKIDTDQNQENNNGSGLLSPNFSKENDNVSSQGNYQTTPFTRDSDKTPSEATYKRLLHYDNGSNSVFTLKTDGQNHEYHLLIRNEYRTLENNEEENINTNIEKINKILASSLDLTNKINYELVQKSIKNFINLFNKLILTVNMPVNPNFENISFYIFISKDITDLNTKLRKGGWNECPIDIKEIKAVVYIIIPFYINKTLYILKTNLFVKDYTEEENLNPLLINTPQPLGIFDGLNPDNEINPKDRNAFYLNLEKKLGTILTNNKTLIKSLTQNGGVSEGINFNAEVDDIINKSLSKDIKVYNEILRLSFQYFVVPPKKNNNDVTGGKHKKYIGGGNNLLKLTMDMVLKKRVSDIVYNYKNKRTYKNYTIHVKKLYDDKDDKKLDIKNKLRCLVRPLRLFHTIEEQKNLWKIIFEKNIGEFKFDYYKPPLISIETYSQNGGSRPNAIPKESLRQNRNYGTVTNPTYTTSEPSSPGTPYTNPLEPDKSREKLHDFLKDEKISENVKDRKLDIPKEDNTDINNKFEIMLNDKVSNNFFNKWKTWFENKKKNNSEQDFKVTPHYLLIKVYEHIYRYRNEGEIINPIFQCCRFFIHIKKKLESGPPQNEGNTTTTPNVNLNNNNLESFL